MYAEKFEQDYMVLDGPNENIKILHFANPDSTIHDCSEDWIKEYWLI